jgi:hypothetical protein
MEVWGLAKPRFFEGIHSGNNGGYTTIQISGHLCLIYKKKKKNLDLSGHGRKMEVIKICFTFY